VLRSVPTR